VATIQFTFVSVCAGGDHLRVNVNVDGTALNNLALNADEVLTQIVADEAPRLATDILRIRMKGKTRAQARADLQAGFTITI
jgi:hypothetical protein